MKQSINFTKMHGAGNDFVILDCINQSIDIAHLNIPQMGHRHLGVGFDQLLLIEKPSSPTFDFKYRIFNADGNEVEQCGNGARCFAYYVINKGLTDKKHILVETAKGQIILSATKQGIQVDMGEPFLEPASIPLKVDQQQASYDFLIDDKHYALGAVSMGNPHIVYVTEDIANGEFELVAPKLRSHPLLPEQANVGFMQVLSRNSIKLRVFERGVGETLACGSGACAAVVVGIHQGILDNKVSVELPGGILYIEWQPGNTVIQTGPAEIVFEGTYRLS